MGHEGLKKITSTPVIPVFPGVLPGKYRNPNFSPIANLTEL